MGPIRPLQKMIASIRFESVWIISLSPYLKRDLDEAGVHNNGVEEDPETHDKYISFYDPDDIA